MALRQRMSFAIAFLLALIVSKSVPPAFAHGEHGDHLLEDARVGRYLLSVTALPNQLRAGRMIFTIEVLDAQSQLPATDSEILVQILPQAAPYNAQPESFLRPSSAAYPVRIEPSPTGSADLSLHEFEFSLEEQGHYRAIVQIKNDSGWVGETGFDFQVLPASPWMKWIIIGLLAQAALYALWLAKDYGKVWRRDPRRGILVQKHGTFSE